MTDEERQKMRSDLSVDQAALAQSNAEPDPTKVICPNCAHQFGAISVADQERLRTQSDAEPQDIREALADIRALEVRLAEQKQLNELLAEELKQTNLSLKDRSGK